jgi:hypothetical protein
MEAKVRIQWPEYIGPERLVGRPVLDEDGVKVGVVTDAIANVTVIMDGTTAFQRFPYADVTIELDGDFDLPNRKFLIGDKPN